MWWAVIYEFYSKFHSLSSSERILKIGKLLAKPQQIEPCMFFGAQCSIVIMSVVFSHLLGSMYLLFLAVWSYYWRHFDIMLIYVLPQRISRRSFHFVTKHAYARWKSYQVLFFRQYNHNISSLSFDIVILSRGYTKPNFGKQVNLCSQLHTSESYTQTVVQVQW